MKMKIILVPLLVLLMCGINGYSKEPGKSVLFQVGPTALLADSRLEGIAPLAILEDNGDFGIGTFDSLDGEMVMLDGTIYKVKGDLSVVVPPKTDTTPLAMVTEFKTDFSEVLKKDYTSGELEKYILSKLPNPSLIYAIKVTGQLKEISGRSAYPCTKPYKDIATVFKTKINNHKWPGPMKATIVGFWFPDYFKSKCGTTGKSQQEKPTIHQKLYAVNMPGFHFHFIDKDKKTGGHLYSTKILKGAVLEICYISRFSLVLGK